MLLGEEPGPNLVKLYTSGKAGFSDTALDEERFLAVTMLTLQKTMRKTMLTPSRVFLLVPPTHYAWVERHYDDVSAAVFRALRSRPGTLKANGQLAKMIGECFKMVFASVRVLQLPGMPEAWTSFGFSKEDPLIPDWMRGGLL